MQEIEDAHMCAVIAHRNVAVLGHHVIDADHARISRSRLETKQRLRKHLFLRKTTQHLINETDLHAARGSFIWLAAVSALAAQGLRRVEMLECPRHIVAQSASQKFLAQFCK